MPPFTRIRYDPNVAVLVALSVRVAGEPAETVEVTFPLTPPVIAPMLKVTAPLKLPMGVSETVKVAVPPWGTVCTVGETLRVKSDGCEATAVKFAVWVPPDAVAVMIGLFRDNRGKRDLPSLPSPRPLNQRRNVCSSG